MAVDIVTAVSDQQERLAARRARWLALVVVLVLWGLITHGTYAGTGDEPHYQIMAHSLAFDRDLDLTNDYGDLTNRSLGGRFAPGAHILPGKDGRLRPVHDIGMPLLFTPYYAAAYMVTDWVVTHVPAAWLDRARLNFNVVLRHLMSFAMIGLTAAIAVRLLGIFSVLAGAGRRAFAWALLMVLSPPLMSHSFLFFTEIASAFIALHVFMWLRGTMARGPAAHSRLKASLAGAATGFLLLLHARNAGLIAGLLIVALRCLRRAATFSQRPDRGVLAAFIGGALVLFAVRTGVTYHFWGTWLTTPHARLGAVSGLPPMAGESITRIVGWLFDQEHGLLAYAPIYLLAPAGWFALRRRDRELCTDITILVAAYVAVMTMPILNAHGWRGGWTPAARFLVPVAPFLAILAFSAVARLRRLPVIVLAIVTLQVCLDAILWQYPGLLWNDGTGSSALLKFLDRGTGQLSSYVPSIFPPLPARTVAIVAGALAFWLLFTGWVTRLTAELTETAE
jgi:hypothetical protein